MENVWHCGVQVIAEKPVSCVAIKRGKKITMSLTESNSGTIQKLPILS